MLKFSFFNRNAEIDKAKSKARIRLNIFFIFCTLGAAIFLIRRGKELQALGVSMEKENIERKKVLREEYLKSQEMQK